MPKYSCRYRLDTGQEQTVKVDAPDETTAIFKGLKGVKTCGCRRTYITPLGCEKTD